MRQFIKYFALLVFVLISQSVAFASPITGAGGNNAGGQTAQADQFTGAVTYSIPIPLPPARGSVQPQLSLDYNSHRKNANSWVGYGWEMDLGAIERTAHEGQIDYVSGTHFQARLAGQTETIELVEANISNAADYGVSLPSGAQADLYRSKIESAFNYYIKIYKTGTAGTDYGWVILDKSGTMYEYGGTSNSKESIPCPSAWLICQPQTAKWYLDRVTDVNQNTMEVTYDSNRNIQEITYQDIRVAFTTVAYNKFPVYRQSFVPQSGYKLNYFQVFSNGSLIEQFQFDYNRSNLNGISYLSSIQQLNRAGQAELPATTFEYYDESTMAWSTTSYDRQASVNQGGLKHKGFLDYYLTLIDMNGDGLKDKVVSYEHSDTVHVFYNDGNDFVYINGKSDWTDPLGADVCDSATLYHRRCIGQLNAYFGEGLEPRQWVYLMDINGDSLPDRIQGRQDPTNPFINYLDVYLNLGDQWDATAQVWNDYAVGAYPGTSDRENFFLDMNGDGLVDRVTSAETGGAPDRNDGLYVYYNTGTNFDSDAVFWDDPAVEIDEYSGCLGLRQATYTYAAGTEALGGTYCDVRDFNGDGLPDRLYKNTLTSSSGTIGTGWIIFLNLNGERFAEAQFNSSGQMTFDGHEVTYVLDNQTGNPGYISNKQDLIDMNGDGYLDLVRGRPDDGEFDIYFYRGIEPGVGYAEYKNGITLTDPVPDPYADSWNGKGYLSNSNGLNVHTLLMDIDGDGLPDRISFDPKNTDENTSRTMLVYPMQMNAVEFSETSSIWNNPYVNQPSGKLKGVNSGTGSISKVEYLPSTWPRRWSSNFSGLPLNHRFLPFNMWVGFKMYGLDYSLSTSETGPESARYPGMRWTRHDYYGGNYFIKNKTSTQDRFTQFNGFQEVTVSTQKGVAETWKDFSTTTIFHQTIGDVNPVDPLDDADFEMSAYDHFALAGKPFTKVVEEDGINLSTEVSDYTVLNSSGTYGCNDPDPCIPQLVTQTKVVREPGSATSRTTQVSFEYDDWNNPTVQTHKDSAGNVLIVQETEYYDYTDFTSTLHLRDRPRLQQKTDGSTVYKYKEFAYDNVGNPIEEKWQVTTSDMATVTRQFNSNGTVKQMTDADGVSKYFTYDSDGLFPITETVYLPSGMPLSTQRWYNRMLGKPYKEIGPSGVGKQTVFDDYGRPTEEYLIDATGTRHKIKWYDYAFEDVSINGWAGHTVSKTQVWTPIDDYPDTSTLASKISYADGAGGGLQSCTLAENGQYRMVQARSENGGRTDISTHPVFVSNCTFEPSLLSASLKTTSYKDMQGRALYTETPGSDAGSPVDIVQHSYSITSDGYFRKEATDSSGKTIVKKFDDFERLKSVTDPMGLTLEYTYDVVGNLREVYEGGTLLTRVDYDVMGRKTEMWDANLGTWNYYYDSKGRMDYQTDNKGNRVQFHYDTISRVIKKEYFKGDGSLERYEEYLYDSGDSVHDVLPGEKFAVVEYDQDGTEVRKTRFGYTTNLRKSKIVTRTIDGLGEFAQTFTYDSKGVLLSTTYPGGESLHHKYARTGAVEKLCSQSTCNESNNELYFYLNPNDSYDSYGSILKEYYGNGVQNQYEYYPKTHRLKTKRVVKDDNKYSERHYEYDVYTNLLKIDDTTSVVGSGGIKNIIYDDLNRLTSYTPQDQTLAKTLSHANNGNLLTNSYSYGSNTYEYTSSKPHAVTKVGDETFTYDDNGNMLTDKERTMEYNSSNQLTKVTMKNGTIVDFEYDFTGARVKKHVHRQDAYNHVMENSTYYLGEAMEIKDGNLIFHIFANKKKIATKKLGNLDELLAGTGSTAALKNIQREFNATQTTPFALLAMGLFLMFSMRPVRQKDLVIARNKVTRQSLPLHLESLLSFVRRALRRGRDSWNAYATAFQETILTLNHKSFAKALSFALVSIFIIQGFTIQPAFATTMNLQMQAQKGSEPGFYYYHGDHLGSAHVITEGEDKAKHAGYMYNKGDLLQRIEYHPYGQEKFVLNPNIKLDPSFTGQTYDVSTGLYYYKARYYNPKLARFTQADTVIPSVKDLQSYNRYTYTRSNPLKYTDPSGHSFWSAFKKIGGAFLGALIGGAVMIGMLASFGVVGVSALAMIKAASFAELVFAGAVGGLVGGAISGGISGGVRGAAMGALMGFIGGGVSGGMGNLTLGLSETAQAVIGGASITIGAGYSYKTGGWEGIATFGAALAGAALGTRIGHESFGKNSPNGMGGGDSKLVQKVIQKELEKDAYKVPDKFLDSEYYGKMSIISNVEPDADFTGGHAWIRLDRKDGKVFTMSLYGNTGEQEFWMNRPGEINSGFGVAHKTVDITKAQAAQIMEYNAIKSNTDWTVFRTCAGYSVDLWNTITGDSLTARDWLVFTTPRSLTKSIRSQ